LYKSALLISKKNIGRGIITLISLIILFTNILTATAQEKKNLFYEDFNDLDNWRPISFPKIKKNTIYTIVKEGNKNYLRAESNDSASALVNIKEFNVYEYPKVKWKWKISNVYKNGNETEKSGDDYPVRIYILFKFDYENASVLKRIKYSIAKRIYGEYPPHTTLNYIWANRKHTINILTSPYTNESKMIILEAGPEKSGMWLEEEVNIIEDYRRAFSSDPPATASLAIMNDSDNTGESSVSFIEYIEVYK